MEWRVEERGRLVGCDGMVWIRERMGDLGIVGWGCARRAKQKWNTRRHWRPASQRAEEVDVVEGMNVVDGRRRENTQGAEELSSVEGIRRYREDTRDDVCNKIEESSRRTKRSYLSMLRSRVRG